MKKIIESLIAICMFVSVITSIALVILFGYPSATTSIMIGVLCLTIGVAIAVKEIAIDLRK